MPAQVAVILTDEEKSILEGNVRSRKTPFRLRQRSEIVLLAANQLPNYRIAKVTIQLDGAEK